VGFFDSQELDVKAPAGESGTLDEWAIQGLTDKESDDFMDALTETKVGDRVRAVRWATSAVIDDNETVPPGTLGTVVGIPALTGELAQVWVEWDNGSRISLLPDRDQWEVV